MSGNATPMAAWEVRKILPKKADEILKTGPEPLDLVDREITAKDGSGHGVSLTDAVKACASDGLPLYHVARFKAPTPDESG